MSIAEAIIITAAAFLLAGLICIPFSDTALLVPLFLVVWFLIAWGLAELSNRKRKR